VGNNDGRIAGPLIYGSTKTAYGALGSNETAFYSNSSTTIMSDGASTVIKFAAGGNTEGMRLTSTGLGIGTSSPATKLNLYGSNVAGVGQLKIDCPSGDFSQLTLYVNNVSQAFIRTNASALDIGTASSTPFTFHTNGNERMRLDTSGNLLVGATAPYTAAFTGISVQGLTSGTGNLSLGLNKAGTPQILSGDVLGNIYFYGVDNDITAGNNNIGARIASIATTNWTTDGTTSNAALVFYTHGTASGAPEERARIDSSGNLGLGVTPSAWDTLKAIQLSGGSLSSFSTYQNFLSANAFYQGGWKYVSTNTAGQYLQDGNVHKFFTAPSGTAGNAITFTQALTLDANGKLILGSTTAPTAHMMKIASTTEAGVAFTGSNTVANDGTIDFAILNAGMLMVSDNNTGDGALFFCCFTSATITLLSDPNNKFATSITAGKISVTKNANSYTVTLTNKSGSSKGLTFSKVSTSD
jgi:hypothetical protein